MARVVSGNDPVAIAEAVAILRRGGVVAIPTETVYGLAAHALDSDAVARIYAAKGRPSNNPLIVHVATVEQARALSSAWPADADALATAFWPGPLSIVVPRAASVPDIVTAGGPTVAIRIPSHPVALAILASGLPLAAPSANRSNAVSPTMAKHVELDVDLIVDGGPTTAGIESTVVHLDPPRLLRPGIITPAEIEAVIGPLARSGKDAILPSPGMMARHYAPRATLEVREDDAARVRELRAAGVRVAWIAFDGGDVTMPRDARAYASRLYATLHDLDAAGVEHIVVAALPASDDWLGVRDRLARASR
jgi:L-threonylcarbamoyladenylate synthase